MKMRSTCFTIALCGVFVGATQAGARGCSGNAGTCNTSNTASVLIPALVKLAMSTSTTTLTAPTADQVDLGATISDAGPTFTVKANRSWTLITASDAVLTSGAGASAATAAAAFFKTNYPAGFTNAANEPGTYTLRVVFTLTAP